MPFYEYECQACGTHHEVLQKISDEPLKKCPDCGKPKLKKLVSAPVFRLKGGGWYETDFKSDQENKRNLAGREEDSSSSETKAESKETPSTTEAKPEPKTPAAKPAPKKAAAKPVAKPTQAKPAKSAVKKKKPKR